jgi:hypothetical protein
LANWHFVMPYDEAAADWLAANGYPHPPARPGNRLPTWAEVEQAVECFGVPPDAPLAIEPGVELLKVRGDLLLSGLDL